MTARHPPRTATAWAAALAGMAMLCSACAPSPTPAPTPSVSESPAPSPGATGDSSPEDRLRVVTVGDSLMSGLGLDLRDAWPVLLAGRAHLSLTNLACAGMGFVVSGGCGTPYEGFSPALAALQPQVIIVESSSNDFGEDPDDIHAETLTTIEQMHEAVPGALLVGLSTIWDDDDDMPEEVATTSEALRDALDVVGGVYVDVGQPLAGHPDWMQDDGVHPTARGQRAIEETVATRLREAGVLP